MKLRDIDESLVEAQPAGFLSRAATKLKKHKPFDKQARQQAAGEEVTQLAANQIAGAFNVYLGQAGASGINPKALTVSDLMDFFKDEGYAKTAQAVIQAAAEVKKPKLVDRGDDEDNEEATGDIPEESGDDAKPEVDTSASIYEARLKALLEDDEEEVTFNPKEVSKLIMKIVGTVHKHNRKGLESKVKAEQEVETPQNDFSDKKPSKKAPKKAPNKASANGVDVDNTQQLEALWSEMISNLQLDDSSAQILKVAFDNARKKVASGKLKSK